MPNVSAVTNESSGSNDASAPPVASPVTTDRSSELPFLVTNWLLGYANNQNDALRRQTDGSGGNQEALDTIRHAAAKLAGAFSSIGVFGSSFQPSLSSDQSILHSQNDLRNATFMDMKRRWSNCPTDQLNHIVGAALSAGFVADSTARNTSISNLCQASFEGIQKQRDNPETGRSLREAIVLDNTPGASAQQGAAVSSALQPPVVFGEWLDEDQKPRSADVLANGNLGQLTGGSDATLSMSVVSKLSTLASNASQSVRHLLQLRDKVRKQSAQIQSIKRSLEFQQKTRSALERDRQRLFARNGDIDAASKMTALDEIKEGEQNCNRVISQLQRQLTQLENSHEVDAIDLDLAEAAACATFRETRSLLQNYRDPFGTLSIGSKTRFGNRLLLNLTSRQLGFDRLGSQNMPRSMGRIRPIPSARESRKTLLYSRLSHAATINAHQAYPVYCLRFDRTGRYFITGADDFLMKVFCIAEYATGKRKIDSGTQKRGAILVTTLRGHAGVINDIAVSSDNSFLATASEDGDVRIWGLKDGCPVAILRGHEKGATMIGWSTLTPYRLVTTGTDGLARTWDIREACLKRYGKMIGKRPEYRVQLTEEERQTTRQNDEDSSLVQQPSSGNLPPLPVRQIGVDNSNAERAPQPPAAPPIPPPPLPPAGGAAVQQNEESAENAGETIEAGRFVANDAIDEGVKLISKLQHGASMDEQMGGPGTRSRRSRVNVICVALCPHGGHFATGSDDGICRIWRDDDDPAVETVDRRQSSTKYDFYSAGRETERSSPRRPSNRLLMQLKGHLSAITDLQYSRAGNRILTASQRDGVVRIWSWKYDPASSLPSHGNRSLSHILIKLTNPNSCSPSTAAPPPPSRRPNRSRGKSQSKVSCDVASWVHDDAKVVTSQCELVKQDGTACVPGSQFIFLWDSYSGNCLLGISEAHSAQCQVVIPHPTDSSIICSAGADGIVKIWDWDSGRCVFQHKNTVDFGPVDARDRGKTSGFLDGAFDADGTTLVLTDDCGRITMFDSLLPCGQNSTENSVLVESRVDYPSWMKQQYFSNDYYDVFYDSNGYCVEQGSNRPPHLAPRGARCSHSGAPFSDSVTEAFKHLVGPQPSPQNETRWHRQMIRSNGCLARDRCFTLPGNLVSEFDPQTTLLIRSSGQIAPLTQMLSAASNETTQNTEAIASPTPRSNSRLSSSYRWGTYEDLIREQPIDEQEEPETDDEEYQLTEGRSRRLSSRAPPESDSEDEELDDYVVDSPRAVASELPSRSSSRTRRSLYPDSEESDDDVIEMMSTNNVPSGPFVADYDEHFFRVPKAADVCRRWLCRIESNSSYAGRKGYTPQVGDVVVYVPRAHYETINQFPSLVPPWQNWPEEASWPVVRCCISNIRYRFPYKAYFGRNNTGLSCKSLVAILTLEITGIPELSRDRRFAWPKPAFIAPTKKHIFELSLFENGLTDFIIPLGLYTARLTKLEYALRQADAHPEIEVLYADEQESEDTAFVPFKGHVESHSDNSSDIPQANLCGSGYLSVPISWEDGVKDTVSPWEVNIVTSASRSPADRPSLTEEEKKEIRDALISIKEDSVVDDIFSEPVDERRFSDYSSRVEVPMDLSFISNRLEADYYATKFSVVADVRLIRDNCIKYNSESHDLSAVASRMFQQFEKLVLKDEELISWEDVIANASTREQSRHERDGVTENTGPIATRRTRRQVQSRSSLEDLPLPLATRTRDQPNRRTDQALSNHRLRRSSRSVLEQFPEIDRSQNRRSSRTRASRRSEEHVDRYSSTTPSQARTAAEQGGRAARAAARARQSSLEEEPSIQVSRTSQSVEVAVHSELPTRNTRSRNRSEVTQAESFASTVWRGSARRSSRRQVASYADMPSDVDEADAELEESDKGSIEPNEDGEDELPSESEESSSSEQQVAATRNRSSNRRSVRRGNDSSSDEEPDNDSDEDEDDKYSNGRRPRTLRASSRATGRRTSNRFNTETKPDEVDGATSGFFTKKRAATDLENDRLDKSRRRSSRDHVTSYVEPDSSEFGSDNNSENDSGSSDLESGNEMTRRKGKPSRSKRRKKSDVNGNFETSRKTEDWPEIGMRYITKVTKNILERLKELDESGIFAVPVSEAFPEVADDYSKVVAHPMDFRTIEEDRLPSYQSITELQQDLTLVFENCMKYNNEPDSEFARLAQLMLDSAEGAFWEACKELRVHPRARK